MNSSLAMAVVTCLACGTAWPAGDSVSGQVISSHAEAGVLTQRPLAGASVIVGRGIMLEVGSDGQDRVVGSEPDADSLPAFRHVQSDGEGRFRVPAPSGSGPLDILVWRTGYTPVLRQRVEPRDDLIFHISPCPSPDLHRSLLRPDGRLVLDLDRQPTDAPFVDPSLGLLLPLPRGFARQPNDGHLTLFRASDGISELRVIRAVEPLDRRALAELLEDQLLDESALLVRSLDVLVGGRWATRREFIAQGRRTVCVYLSRSDAGAVLVFSSPEDVYDDAVEAFESSLAGVRLAGTSSAPTDWAVVMRSRRLGVEVGLNERWQPVRESSELLRAERRHPEISFEVRAVPTPEGCARSVVADELSRLGAGPRITDGWALVSGCAGYDASAVTAPARGSGASFVRAVAVTRPSDTLIIVFTGPARMARRCLELTDAVLDGVTFGLLER